MADWNRQKIGKITKKTPERQRFKDQFDDQGNLVKKGVPEFVLQIDLPPGVESITLKKGEYINLENKAFALASLEANAGKMSEDSYNKALERINKTPEFVFFDLIKVKKG